MGQKIKNEKVVGYALLTVGVAMIFISVYLMFNVFTGDRAPPVLVHFSDISLPSVGQTEPITLVTGQELDKLVAMSFWYILMFFIMWAGGKLGSLGVSLIKETRVEVKELAPAIQVAEGINKQEEQDVEETVDTREEETEDTHQKSEE